MEEKTQAEKQKEAQQHLRTTAATLFFADSRPAAEDVESILETIQRETTAAQHWYPLVDLDRYHRTLSAALDKLRALSKGGE